ncbi:aldo/keto reductase [Paenibacillus silagei]|uniref:Diketogulonate reductase-like aldo/keto reductase n=1 Tax=Paenibacillus silagei TaxID=1670801 RepID=A0ABS4NM15_9BACL|nr:aldo/keto reductase [Paenibacillus silagei]MBP2111071.1 diketogulonate reductase-like aldo/keto reductase [Paenibacillus silagei]
MMNLKSATKLANGVEMPWFGLGVFKVQEGQEVIDSVKTAIKAGYRSIDTASVYGNEEGVGQAIRESGVAREELFITTKVWNTEQGYDSTLAAFDQSLSKLGLDYADLYLVHWPIRAKYKDTWRALEKLYADGKVRAIGVSNFQIDHLEDLLADATVKPMVNQVELHPLLNQQELREYCKAQGIQIEAWAPLAQGHLLDNEVLADIAARHNKTLPQVILRWDLQNGIVTIPKSIKEERIIANADIFDFELSEEEISRINGLNRDQRFGSHPDRFNNE